MGGYGSGRPSYRQKAEMCRSLDVNRFHREGCLLPGRRGNWVWWQDGEEVGRIGYRAEERRLVIEYRVRICGSDWEPITETIRLTYLDCNFGNARPYFRCPGIVGGLHCGRRVGKLFAGGRYFLCRHCYNVSYTSQSEARYDRALRRANKTRMALGGEPGTASWVAPKPKGMWQRTYARHCAQIEHDECQADALFLGRFAGLLTSDEIAVLFRP